MSLINRMLRDLSSRAPESGDVMSGIQLRKPAPRRAGLARAVLWLALVAGFSAVFWLFMPKKPAPVTARAVTAGVASAPAAVERFQMDASMAPLPPGALPTRRRHPRGETAAVAPRVPAPAVIVHAETVTSGDGSVPIGDRSSRPASARDAREAQARYAEARRALSAGDEKGAEQALIDALALDPKLHQAREDLGSLRIRQGRLDEAERSVRRGLEENPDWIGYRRLIARLELAKGQPEAALHVLETAQPSVGSDPEFHGLLASAYQRLKRHEDAAREYQGLLQAQPGDGHWWAGYGISRDALGDKAGALDAYAHARSLGNLDPRLLGHINKRTAELQSAG